MKMFDSRHFFSARSNLRVWAIILFSAFCAYLASICSPIHDYAEMDPRGSSLVAQAMIEHRTMRVDGYKLPASSWLFQVKNGHTYSTYPLGTSLLVLPVVAMALSQGGDMQIDKTDLELQKQVG